MQQFRFFILDIYLYVQKFMHINFLYKYAISFGEVISNHAYILYETLYNLSMNRCKILSCNLYNSELRL